MSEQESFMQILLPDYTQEAEPFLNSLWQLLCQVIIVLKACWNKARLIVIVLKCSFYIQ